MRDLVYFIATTLDGFVAGPDHEVDLFTMDPGYLAQLCADWGDGMPTAAHAAFGTSPSLSRWDTAVMGRTTFEPAIDAGIPDPYAHLDTYVFSTTLAPQDHRGVTIVATDPVAFVRDLKSRDGGAIWLCGGGSLAAALADEVDRLVLKINPVTAGSGVRLFEGPFQPRAWHHESTRAFDAGVLLVEYSRVR